MMYDPSDLAAALQTVLRLHGPDQTYSCTQCIEVDLETTGRPIFTSVGWPCPTVRAIAHHLGQQVQLNA